MFRVTHRLQGRARAQAHLTQSPIPEPPDTRPIPENSDPPGLEKGLQNLDSSPSPWSRPGSKGQNWSFLSKPTDTKMPTVSLWGLGMWLHFFFLICRLFWFLHFPIYREHICSASENQERDSSGPVVRTPCFHWRRCKFHP